MRKRVPVIDWSNAESVATCVVFLDGNVAPKSSERAMRIESGLLEVANCRQATYTFPFVGSIAMFVPWLMELDSESLVGFDQVLPQSSERVNMILVLWLPVNRLQTT